MIEGACHEIRTPIRRISCSFRSSHRTAAYCAAGRGRARRRRGRSYRGNAHIPGRFGALRRGSELLRRECLGDGRRRRDERREASGRNVHVHRRAELCRRRLQLQLFRQGYFREDGRGAVYRRQPSRLLRCGDPPLPQLRRGSAAGADHNDLGLSRRVHQRRVRRRGGGAPLRLAGPGRMVRREGRQSVLPHPLQRQKCARPCRRRAFCRACPCRKRHRRDRRVGKSLRRARRERRCDARRRHAARRTGQRESDRCDSRRLLALQRFSLPFSARRERLSPRRHDIPDRPARTQARLL